MNSEEHLASEERRAAPVPVAVHTAHKLMIAVESGANRVALFAQVEEVMAEWNRALGEPGRVSIPALIRREGRLRSLLDDFRSKTFTRKDRQLAWERYRRAWDEVTSKKEQASAAGKAHFLARVAEIVGLLQESGPSPALEQLSRLQRERGRFLLSKQDSDEVGKALSGLYEQIREDAVRRNPARQEVEERLRRARGFLVRIERAAERTRYRVCENRKEWEASINPLRAALLKQQMDEDENDCRDIEEKVARVRREIEQLDKALKAIEQKARNGPIIAGPRTRKKRGQGAPHPDRTHEQVSAENPGAQV